jgi:outer membrane protein OmpA-like peptidoglycan-associated protein
MSNTTSMGYPARFGSIRGEDTPLWIVIGLLATGTSLSVVTALLLTGAGQRLGPAVGTPRPVDPATAPERASQPNRTSRPQPPTTRSRLEQAPRQARQQAVPATTVSGTGTSHAAPENATAAESIANTTAEARVPAAPRNPAAVESSPSDCPPLFMVNFARGAALPQGTDLVGKARRLGDWLSNHPDARLVIHGHADAEGSEQYNLMLSFRRAQAFQKLLLRGGANAKQLTARAFGEYQPLAGIPEQSPRNRRATVELHGAPDCPLTPNQIGEP